ncbi:MBL fold metallo-hydrolase [Streptomyces sp. B6B3]|uniref:MBL fold metallo-hydrolase n=1 Tax=Streptomyces sp. B6B3 TaxID=3153570 RepID=UPI00325EA955
MSTHPTTALPPRLTEVAENVFAHVQPPGGWCLSNAGIVVDDGARGNGGNGGDTVLVDTAATEGRARRLREAVLRVAGGPPRTVVNTHFHGDHTFGNFVFPEAVVVGHENTRTLVAATGLHLTTLWPEVEWGELCLRPPTVTYADRLTLHAGSLRVELLHVGPAHGTDDTVVWLPERSVLFTGDLTMAGVTPFVPMGSVSGSLAAVARLRKLGARTVVPGHGPVAGPELLDATEAYLRWLRELAAQGLAAGLTPLELAAEADLGEYAELLDAERLVPNLHRAYAEERGLAAGEPLDMRLMFGEMVTHHGGLPACHA